MGHDLFDHLIGVPRPDPIDTMTDQSADDRMLASATSPRTPAGSAPAFRRSAPARP
jgi:hypothetical protein